MRGRGAAGSRGIKVRGNGNLDQGYSDRDGEKWLDSGYMYSENRANKIG